MRQQQLSLIQAKGIMGKAEILWKGREFSVPSEEIFELTAEFKVSAYESMSRAQESRDVDRGT